MNRIEILENQITCINGTLLRSFIQILIYWLHHCLAEQIEMWCGWEKFSLARQTTETSNIPTQTRCTASIELYQLKIGWMCAFCNRNVLAPVLFRFSYNRQQCFKRMRFSQPYKNISVIPMCSRKVHRSTVNSLSSAQRKIPENQTTRRVERIFKNDVDHRNRARII